MLDCKVRRLGVAAGVGVRTRGAIDMLSRLRICARLSDRLSETSPISILYLATVRKQKTVRSAKTGDIFSIFLICEMT